MPDDGTKTECRTPATGKLGTTRIPTWKYELLRRHILDLVRENAVEGLAFKDLAHLVAERLTDQEKSELGSVGWHTTTVKLEMEVAGDIKRLEGASPQRLVLN